MARFPRIKTCPYDKRILMSIRVKFLEACVHSRLLYSTQSWELTAAELNKFESIWHGFLRKMITNGFKRKNVPKYYLKAREKKAKYNRNRSQEKCCKTR